jgi:hypothetical protein
MSTTRLGNFKTVNVLRRGAPLADHVAVSATIGAAGGVVHIPEAGLKLSIPQGAFTGDSLVVVSAHPGLLGFTVTVTPEQPLAARATVEQHLEDAHTSKSFLLGHTDSIEAEVDCNEFFYAKRVGNIAVAQVPHFSGYIFAGGNGSGQPCDPDTDGPNCIWVDDA